MKGLAVAFEGFLNVVENSFLPVFVSVVEVPLVAVGHHAHISRSGDHVSSRLVVYNGVSSVDEFFPDQSFGISYFGAFEVTNQHNAFMEALLVGLVLGLLKQLLVVLTLDFELLAQNHRSPIAD